MNSLNNNTMTTRGKTQKPRVIGILVTKENKHSKKTTSTKSPDLKSFSRRLGLQVGIKQITIKITSKR